MSQLTDRRLDWTQITEIARFCELTRVYVYNVAVGNKQWRTASPMLVRQLYGAGWVPRVGRSPVRLWLNVQAERAARESAALLTP